MSVSPSSMRCPADGFPTAWWRELRACESEVTAMPKSARMFSDSGVSSPPQNEDPASRLHAPVHGQSEGPNQDREPQRQEPLKTHPMYPMGTSVPAKVRGHCVKNRLSTAATVFGSATCDWPSNVRRSACGRLAAIASAACSKKSWPPDESRSTSLAVVRDRRTILRHHATHVTPPSSSCRVSDLSGQHTGIGLRRPKQLHTHS